VKLKILNVSTVKNGSDTLQKLNQTVAAVNGSKKIVVVNITAIALTKVRPLIMKMIIVGNVNVLKMVLTLAQEKLAQLYKNQVVPTVKNQF
jgi:hypothetical protein